MTPDGKWWSKSWNPETGCTPVSKGCDNCWARAIHTRFAKHRSAPPFSTIQLHPERLEEPLKWRKRQVVAVNLNGDLFHRDVPTDFIVKVFMVMAMTPQHVYLILTKRAERMAQVCIVKPWLAKGVKSTDGKKTFTNTYGILPNVWLGTSVEDQATADKRIPQLLKCPAAHRFVSLEPLLGPVAFRHEDKYPWVVDLLHGTRSMPDCDDPAWDGMGEVQWIIIGAESGPRARPMELDWVRSIVAQCRDADVPAWLKQCMVGRKRANMPMLDGVMYDQMPEELSRVLL